MFQSLVWIVSPVAGTFLQLGFDLDLDLMIDQDHSSDLDLTSDLDHSQ